MRHTRLGIAILLGLVLLVPSKAVATWPGANGRIVFDRSGGGSRNLVTFDARGRHEMVLSRDKGDRYASWSPDGTKIVFIRGPRKNNGIFIMSADGSDVRGAPGRTARSEVSPSWSPDGKRILFAMSDGGFFSVYKQRLDGTDRVKLAENAAMPSWSPNGRRIAFVRPMGRDFEVYTMRSNGSDVRRVTDDGQYDFSPVWSPGGKMLLVTRFSARNRGDIWKVAADGSWEKKLTESRAVEAEGVWSPNGRFIVYVREPFDGSKEADLWLMTSAGRFVRRLTDTPGAEANPDWQPLP